MAVDRHVVATFAQRKRHAHLRVQVADERPARDEKASHQRDLEPFCVGTTALTASANGTARRRLTGCVETVEACSSGALRGAASCSRRSAAREAPPKLEKSVA